MRKSGYKGTHYALAELIDNAFDAKATICKIIVIEKPSPDQKNKSIIDKILVCDDGIGMPDEQLSICLQLGGTTNEVEEDRVKNKKIGKFGFGLPSASLNQCRDIKVISWDKPNNYRKSRLDFDALMDKKTVNMPEIQSCSINTDLYAKTEACIDNKHGTIVSWEKCDQVKWKSAKGVIENTAAACGQIFRHYLKDGRSIEFASYKFEKDKSYVLQLKEICQINDPLFLTKDAYISQSLNKVKSGGDDQAKYYNQFSKGAKKSSPTNIRLGAKCYSKTFSWAGNKYTYSIVTSIAHPDIQHPGRLKSGKLRSGGNNEVGKFYGKTQHHCINFVRANREIASGSFPNSTHARLYTIDDDRARWWSIEVAFESDLDDLLGVDNKKQGIDYVRTDKDDHIDWNEHTASEPEARERLWVQLTDDIMECAREATKVVNDRGNHDVPIPPMPSPSPIPGPEPITPTIVDPEPDRISGLSPVERAELIQLLKETYQQISEEEIAAEVDHYDREKRQSIMLYAPLAYAAGLWDVTSIQGKKVILINTKHNFYAHYIQGLKSDENKTGITAVELFLHSLAINMFSDDPKEKSLLENIKSYTGITLKNYVEALQDMKIDEGA